MVEQNKEASSTPSMQAGPAHGNNGVQSDMESRVIRTVGRQLAQIGDELNQQWGDRLPQAHQNIRRSNTTLPQGRIYKLFVSECWKGKFLAALVKLWSDAPVHNQAGRISGLPSDWPCWTTGLLVSAALVATAAVCIAFWELKKDFRL